MRRLNTLEFTALVGGGALLTGFLGSLSGPGGGVVIVLWWKNEKQIVDLMGDD
jgi:hypothetical protein